MPILHILLKLDLTKLFHVFIFKTKLASILSSTLRICRRSPSTLQFATWMHLVSRMGHHLSKLGTYILPWISCLGEQDF
uniref:Uncharacterized protein n=1 Tax=Meleagris gallopavo TaxID=9103 RepID=A0A803YPJ3_MELGA